MNTLSKSIEITEQNLEKAIDAASNKFGVPKEQLLVQILEEKKTLFGKEQVRIKAEIKAEYLPNIDSIEENEEPLDQEVLAVPIEEKVEPVVLPKIEATIEDSACLSEYLEKIIQIAELKIKAQQKKLSGRYVQFELEGEDVSHLLEKNGQSLNALQFIMNMIASKQLGNGVRVTLDASQYRTKREKALENLAINIAEEVKQRKEEAVLDELPAFERRVIHQALQDYPGIVTYSEGEEPHRRVVIAAVEE